MTRTDTARQLASRPQGVTAAEMVVACKISSDKAGQVLYLLTQRGADRLLMARVQGHRQRWFVSPEHHAAWLRETKPCLTTGPGWRVSQRAAGKLHPIGEHMPALARNGVMVTPHQATRDRQRQATVKMQAPRPVDYSRAVVTVCPSPRDARYEVVGPVRSVVDARECRDWARAATGCAA